MDQMYNFMKHIRNNNNMNCLHLNEQNLIGVLSELYKEYAADSHE